MPDQFLAPITPTSGAQTHIFLAGFHLGFDLVRHPGLKAESWSSVRSKLLNHLAKKKGYTIVHRSDTASQCPLGPCLMVQFPKSSQWIDPQNSKKEQHRLANDDWNHGLFSSSSMNSEAWIFASGAVLIIGSFPQPVANEAKASTVFQSWIELRYLRISTCFVELAHAIFEALVVCKIDFSHYEPKTSPWDILHSKDRREKILEHASSDGDCFDERFPEDDRLFLYNLLLDVYYLEMRCIDKELNRWISSRSDISYIRAELDPDEIDSISVYYLVLCYSSFVSVLWLQKCYQYLLDRVGLQSDRPVLSASQVLDIKSLRTFSIRLIHASRPMSIRITERYLVVMDSIWRELRLDHLCSQIVEGMETLSEVTDWMAENDAQVAESRISTALYLISVVSVVGIVAQLVDFFDIGKDWAIELRFRLLLIIVCIILLPLIVLGFTPRARMRVNQIIGKISRSVLPMSGHRRVRADKGTAKNNAERNGK